MIELQCTNYFHDAMHFLAKKENKPFFLHIGAMDGISFDEMESYIRSYALKGLFVEPVPEYFEALKKNFEDSECLFENSAISSYNGEITMLTIDKTAIDDGSVHGAYAGMSAVFPPKNGLGSKHDRQVVELYGKKIIVPCLSFATLMEKYGILKFDILKVDAEGHDFQIFKQINLQIYLPDLIRIEWCNLDEFEQKEVLLKLENAGYKYGLEGQDLVGIASEIYQKLYHCDVGRVTLVTGLWDIQRDTLSEGWSRSYAFYKEKFRQLLEVPDNLIVFGDASLRSFVFQFRSDHNTQFIERTQDWFVNEFYEKIQQIRIDKEWYSQTSWLVESTQASLPFYNPLVMSKPFLLHDAKLLDRFNSSHLFWVDAGITNTVHPGYFTQDRLIEKLKKLTSFTFIAFPYQAKGEIHGFAFDKLCELAGARVNKVCRGGFFGGPVASISTFNGQYYQLLSSTLKNGLMGTEESLFTILLYQYPFQYQYFPILEDGLISTFFENLKNNQDQAHQEWRKSVKHHNGQKVALYVLTYNSPLQLESLITSMKEYDDDFLHLPDWILLNNSTDSSTMAAYEELCTRFGIKHFKKENIGICGGRQWVAEHAAAHDYDYYFFFEDDMSFYQGMQPTCKNGFIRNVPELYRRALEIISNEQLDFLKLNFSEFYGDHQLQWSWHNVPKDIRAKLFKEKPEKVSDDLNEAPFLNFKAIKSFKGLAFATGEVFYSNWPQLVSKIGNYKMFLEVKWKHPFEQTWMSYIYQQTVKKHIHPAVLLATPTEHHRFEFYPAEERKEN